MLTDTVQSFVREWLNWTSYQWLGPLLAVLFTRFAIKLGYLYILSQKERPVEFHVASPPELSAEWEGKKWSEIGSKDREILEGQARGVSGVHLWRLVGSNFQS